MKQTGWSEQTTLAAAIGAKTQPRGWGEGAQALVGGALGLLLPQAALFGACAPLGIGLAAAANGKTAPLVGICAAIGYLLAFDPVTALIYVAAVIAVVGLRWVAALFPQWQERAFLAPLFASVSFLAVHILLPDGFSTGADALYILANTLLAALAAIVCRTCAAIARQGAITTADERACLCLLAAMTVAAAARFEVGDVSPARMIAIALVVAVAQTDRKTGAFFGVACALFVALTAPAHTAFALLIAAAALVGGLTKSGQRVLTALLLLPATVILFLTLDPENWLMGCYEGVAGGLLWVIFPLSWERSLRQFLRRREEQDGVFAYRWQWQSQHQLAAQTLSEMAQTVEAVSEKLAGLSGPSLGDVFTALGDTVCRRCPRSAVCWTAHYDRTMSALQKAVPVLRQEGRCDAAHFGELPAACPHRDALADAVNEGYTAHRLREDAWRRLTELRQGMTGQWELVGALLKDGGDAMPFAGTMDISLAARLRELCADWGFPETHAVCQRRDDGRVWAELWVSGEPPLPDEDFKDAAEKLCGQALATPVLCKAGGVTRVTLLPPPQFRLAVGVARQSYRGEALCGDATEVFTDRKGRGVVILCDGMGCGGRAAVDGTMTATLTARLLTAGFGEDNALQLVNTALMVRAGEESLSTVDMLTVDLYTGEMTSRKAGAATSLLCSRGKVSRIDNPSLPVGILREVAFSCANDRLAAGDTVLLCSDGVYQDGCGWVETLLAAFSPDESPESLAKAVVAEAARRQPPDHGDDITAIAIRIEAA